MKERKIDHEEGKDYLKDLPQEIRSHIYSYLPGNNLRQLRYTNHFFDANINNTEFLIPYCEEEHMSAFRNPAGIFQFLMENMKMDGKLLHWIHPSSPYVYSIILRTQKNTNDGSLSTFNINLLFLLDRGNDAMHHSIKCGTFEKDDKTIHGTLERIRPTLTVFLALMMIEGQFADSIFVKKYKNGASTMDHTVKFTKRDSDKSSKRVYLDKNDVTLTDSSITDEACTRWKNRPLSVKLRKKWSIKYNPSIAHKEILKDIVETNIVEDAVFVSLP